MKKLLVSILLLALILTSCGTGKTGAAQTTAGETQVSQSSVQTAEKTQYAALPKKDYGGKKVNILVRREWKYEFDVETETGDIVDDAIFQRNTAVEEKYGCDLNFIDFAGDWSNHTAFQNIITNSVMAGDGAYDLVAGYQACLVMNIANHEFMNLFDLPYLQLDAPWWTQKGIEDLSMNGKCYMATGDITLSMLKGIFCMFFNKTMAENYGGTDFYKLVENGTWTHAKMAEVIKNVTKDLNGDGAMNEKDMYGFISSGNYVRSYIVAYDTPTVSLSSGSANLIWNTEHTVKVVEALVDLFSGSDAYYVADMNNIVTMFENNQALLVPSMLGNAAALREMDTDFGIIPYPKFDESQKDYYTTTLNEISMMVVPTTVKDSDMSALLLEALCRESHDTVASSFYDVALKTKYTRDTDSEAMIDLIRNSLSFDFGWVHSLVTGVSGAKYQTMVESKDKNFSSWYASEESNLQAKVADAVKAYS